MQICAIGPSGMFFIHKHEKQNVHIVMEERKAVEGQQEQKEHQEHQEQREESKGVSSVSACHLRSCRSVEGAERPTLIARNSKALPDL